MLLRHWGPWPAFSRGGGHFLSIGSPLTPSPWPLGVLVIGNTCSHSVLPLLCCSGSLQPAAWQKHSQLSPSSGHNYVPPCRLLGTSSNPSQGGSALKGRQPSSYGGHYSSISTIFSALRVPSHYPRWCPLDQFNSAATLKTSAR